MLYVLSWRPLRLHGAMSRPSLLVYSYPRCRRPHYVFHPARLSVYPVTAVSVTKIKLEMSLTERLPMSRITDGTGLRSEVRGLN